MTARPLVAAIDAAIKHNQDAIHELMRTRALLVQQYDERDIDTALLDGECVVCGPGECVCGQLSALMRGPAVEVTR